MTPAQLSRTVLYAVRRAAESGQFGEGHEGSGVPGRVVVESPPRRGAGDYAVSVAFQIAKAAGRRRTRSRACSGTGSKSTTGCGAWRSRAAGSSTSRWMIVPGRHSSRSSSSSAYEPRASDTVERPAADIARWSAARARHPAAADRTDDASSPLFHVQYAYARTRALSRNAHDLGFHSDPVPPRRRHRRPNPARGGRSARHRRPDPVRRRSAQPPVRTATTGTPTRPRTAPAHAPCSRSSPTTSASANRPIPRSRPVISSPSATPSSTSTSTARPCPAETRNPGPPIVPGWLSSKPPGRCWQAACPSSASPRPHTSESSA